MNKKTGWLFMSFMFASTAYGYDVITHSRIAEHATEQSVLNDSANGILKTLCSADSADDRRCLLVSSSPFPNTLTPLRLITEGVVREDDGERALNHFFDPQNGGKPLNYLKVNLGDTSPDWALEDRFDVADQSASLSDAKNLLYASFTAPFAVERERALGATFEALGHVMHHLQDMTQPQHVRNDIHCDRFFSTWFAPFPIPSICVAGFAYRPSGYEAYTKSRGRDLPLIGYLEADFGTFALPRQFWVNEGMGVAEFTSNNFVSDGTNFALTAEGVSPHHDYPNPGSHTGRSKWEITHPDLLGPQGPDQPLSGELWFVSNPVVDQYDPASSGLNERASTVSMFSSDLQRSLTHNPRAGVFFSLNRLNFAAANEFLLPRAAAYSTGLINYFFRGRIEIGLPKQGVYGIVDHATTRDAGQGFQKLKLRLNNASPDGVKPSGEKVPQTMQGGTLVAVAKYTLNSCYQPDLSGDFAVTLDYGAVIYPANCTLDQYFAGEEQISQSAAIVAASLDKVAADFTFDFSAKPIPVNARDLRIQVVYTGTLGSETNAIAFGGRDISEPTHLIVYNNSDYYAVDGKFHTPQQIRADATLSQRVQGHNIDPTPLDRVALAFADQQPVTEADEPVGVPVNGYVRVAVLADVDQPFMMKVLTRFEGAGATESTFNGIWAATIDLRGEFAYITPLGIYRDPRAHLVDVVFKANSLAPLLDGELETMSARRAGDPGPIPIPLTF